MIGYQAVHRRLKIERGPAKLRSCVVCGDQAIDWAYDGTDPNEQSSGHKPYSLDLSKYQPLCRKCHRERDRRATCRNGHVLTELNTYLHNGTRFCRDCRREYMRRYRMKSQQGEGNSDG